MIVFQPEQCWDKFFLRIGIAHHKGGFCIDELLCVLGLMVFGGGWQRNKDDSELQAKLSKNIGKFARPNAADDIVNQIVSVIN